MKNTVRPSVTEIEISHIQSADESGDVSATEMMKLLAVTVSSGGNMLPHH
jgi:hypothetical protein